VQQIIAIRNQLSPSTLLMINELGTRLAFWASTASNLQPEAITLM